MKWVIFQSHLQPLGSVLRMTGKPWLCWSNCVWTYARVFWHEKYTLHFQPILRQYGFWGMLLSVKPRVSTRPVLEGGLPPGGHDLCMESKVDYSCRICSKMMCKDARQLRWKSVSSQLTQCNLPLNTLKCHPRRERTGFQLRMRLVPSTSSCSPLTSTKATMEGGIRHCGWTGFRG